MSGLTDPERLLGALSPRQLRVMRLVVEGRVERDPATYEYVGIGVNRQRLAASQTVYSLESLGLVTLATDGSIGPTAAGEAVLDADERRRLET